MHIFEAPTRGVKNKSLKLNNADMNAGSMDERDRGSQAQSVPSVFIATSLLNILGIGSVGEGGGSSGGMKRRRGMRVWYKILMAICW